MVINKIITDENGMEKTLHGTPGFQFEYYNDNIHHYEHQLIDWHWHHEFEFVLVEKGSVLCSANGQVLRLNAGEGVFINSGVLHRFDPAGQEGLMPNILFAPEFIAPGESVIYEKYVRPLQNKAVKFVRLDTGAVWKQDILARLKSLIHLCEIRNEMYEMQAHIQCCEIWMHLWRHISQTEIEAVPRMDVYMHRIKEMIMYIEHHYHKRIALSDIAAAAKISKTEAMRCFRIHLKTSPIRYLNQYRLNCARVLLRESGKSITDIALGVGFESASYFNRLFKNELHCTPGEFRRLQGNNGERGMAAATELE